jgi:hypothetical protein
MLNEYSMAGFVLVSISLDEDLSALRHMVAVKGITWPQICDGKGSIELVRLFNAQTPTQYVLDRDGRIRSKHVGALGLDKIKGTISGLLSESHQDRVRE